MADGKKYLVQRGQGDKWGTFLLGPDGGYTEGDVSTEQAARLNQGGYEIVDPAMWQTLVQQLAMEKALRQSAQEPSAEATMGAPEIVGREVMPPVEASMGTPQIIGRGPPQVEATMGQPQIMSRTTGNWPGATGGADSQLSRQMAMAMALRGR